VVFNSNSIDFRDHGDIDPEWLRRELAAAGEPTYVFQHVNVGSGAYFPPALKKQLEDIYASQPWLKVVFSGHEHVFEVRQAGGKPDHGIARVEGENFAILDSGPSGDVVYECDPSGCRQFSHSW
jgi:hypothetical protein